MHRSRMLNIVLDCDNLAAVEAFWTAALGRHVVYRDDHYVELGPPIGNIWFILQRVPEAKRVKNRMHADLTTDNLDAEVARLEALAARKKQFIEKWWVMEDPCGNEFCVVLNWRDEYSVGAQTWES
ncbi:MAG: VOC family protein [Thermodesulfobacteriota bacterium]